MNTKPPTETVAGNKNSTGIKPIETAEAIAALKVWGVYARVKHPLPEMFFKTQSGEIIGIEPDVGNVLVITPDGWQSTCFHFAGNPKSDGAEHVCLFDKFHAEVNESISAAETTRDKDELKDRHIAEAEIQKRIDALNYDLDAVDKHTDPVDYCAAKAALVSALQERLRSDIQALERLEPYWISDNACVFRGQQHILDKLDEGWAIHSGNISTAMFYDDSREAAKVWAEEEVISTAGKDELAKTNSACACPDSSLRLNRFEDWKPKPIHWGMQKLAGLITNRDWAKYCLCRIDDQTFCLGVLEGHWELLRRSSIIDEEAAKVWAERVIIGDE